MIGTHSATRNASVEVESSSRGDDGQEIPSSGFGQDEAIFLQESTAAILSGLRGQTNPSCARLENRAIPSPHLRHGHDESISRSKTATESCRSEGKDTPKQYILSTEELPSQAASLSNETWSTSSVPTTITCCNNMFPC